MLAEANVAPTRTDDYFGDGDRMHMLFNFLLNQHLFLALAQRATPSRSRKALSDAAADPGAVASGRTSCATTTRSTSAA